MVTFQEIWQVFSPGHGDINGLDAISLSAVFRIAEMEFSDYPNAVFMRKDLLEHESRVIGQPISTELLDELVEVIKQNTRFVGSAVFNADGRRRYENLPVVGFMITNKGFRTFALSDCS